MKIRKVKIINYKKVKYCLVNSCTNNSKVIFLIIQNRSIYTLSLAFIKSFGQVLIFMS